MQTTISKFVEDADYILLIHERCRLQLVNSLKMQTTSC